MSMFCYQCQEAIGGVGCKVGGACGKKEDTAHLQDLLVFVTKGIAVVADAGKGLGIVENKYGEFISQALFATITNANFDNDRFVALIKEAAALRDELLAKYVAAGGSDVEWVENVTWSADDVSSYDAKGAEVGVLSTENEDVRSLRELAVYGLKGLAAYADHASVLGYEDEDIYAVISETLASTTKDLSVDEMVAVVMKTGEYGVNVMALLDKANTETYGNPELTEVNLGVRNNPGILVSGHDLKDMAALLKQAAGSGVDIYTHSEMLPVNYYPEFKKYDNLVGNYGNAWHKQSTEFASFNGPILMTTNCITPVKDAFKDRFYTTGMAGYPGMPHIEAD
ncbi:MAG: hydroxylamine reductase, partial [Kiritimatiellae bacterium]|nr:hydroxylamine reductase [Kiritimatiellia bacterium]